MLLLIGGDDWEIPFTLLDDDGNPIVLTAAALTWTLVNVEGQRVVNEGEYTLTIIDAVAGTCSVMVPSTKTTNLRAGRFTDALRIVSNGVTATPVMGLVQVVADPWRVASGYQFTEVRVVA
jgi:hypothetical protein